MFDNVDELKEFLMRSFSVELSPATTTSSFNLGYIAGTNRRVVIANNINLAEAYSVAKAGWITLWAEAIVPPAVAASRGTKRSLSHATDDLATNPSGNGLNSSEAAGYESTLQRLKTKHSSNYPKFKLKVWAKMLTNSTHDSHDMPPKIPFFTSLKVGKVRGDSPSSTTPATVTTGAILPGSETSETDMTEQK
ncbi:Hypothetical predicted protein, partial [Paramuricea clavata]